MASISKTLQHDADGISLRTQVAGPVPRADEFSIFHRRGPWRDALRRRMLAAADALAVVAAGATVGTAFDGRLTLLWWTLLLPVWLVLAKVHGLYDRDHRVLRHLTADEFPALLAWATTGTAASAAILSLSGAEPLTVSTALKLWLAVLLVAATLRAFARWLWRTGTRPEQTLLLGSGPLEQAARRKIELFSDIHVQVAGNIPDGALDQARHGATRIETLVTGTVDGQPLDRIVLASRSIDESLIAELVAFCRSRHIKLSVVPPARAMFGTAVRLGHVADLPMIEYNTWDVPRSTMLLKRGVDVAVATLGLVLTAPLMAVVALAIRLESGGPSLFAQSRAGFRGRPFRMYKFRTMTVDAERRLPEVVDLEGLDGPAFKLRDDPRVTRVGRMLRRWSLDELPQLINVLKGDMSLVGPRPEVLSLVERYRPEHRIRLHVKPGLTGPMQVYGRGELRFDERLAVEREYVENLSISRDMRILLLTVAPVLWGRGAY